MKAFYSDPARKEECLKRLRDYHAQGRLIQGEYEEGNEESSFRGCFIGCLGHPWKMGDAHRNTETRYGIPHTLNFLLDGLFEGLLDGEAQTFALSAIEAMPVGANLIQIVPRFFAWLLSDPAQGVLRLCSTPESKSAVMDVVALLERYISGHFDRAEWRIAYKATVSAGESGSGVAIYVAEIWCRGPDTVHDASAIDALTEASASGLTYATMCQKLLTLLSVA